MQSCFLSAGRLISAGLLLACPWGFAKPIHLKNEKIDPSSQAAQKQPDHSSLVIIQFSQPPGPGLRRDLEEHGIELAAPVPEDAYIARIRGEDRLWLRSIPSVRWIGAYKPEHKTHKGLEEARSKLKTVVEVKVLVARKSSDPEKTAVKRALDRVDQESNLPMGTILKGRLSLSKLGQLQASDAVLWIEPARDMKLLDEVSSKLVAGDAGPNYLLTQSLGYDGAGVTVAVADSGLNNGDAESMHPDLLGRTPEFLFYGLDDELFDAADEHSHGTHVAGIIAGNGATSEVDENGFLYGLGVAPGASIIAQRIFDGVGNYAAPPSFERLTRDAKRAGADIGSNSWGDDSQGEYDLSAAEFDALTRDCDALTPGDQPYILEFSAGNAGPIEGSIGSPAVGKNVLATGASQNARTEFLIYGDGSETMADFSSRGPCADGRIKPDVVAPGTYIASLQSQSATDEYAWAPISQWYQYQGGTSQAGPHASAAAAVFVQYYRQTKGATPSPALVKAALINSAIDLHDDFGTAPIPNTDEGWGRVDLPTLLDPELQFDYFDQQAPLSQSQVHERSVIVRTGNLPLKITLAYTDVPAMPGAAKALVNDLDLEIIAPDGAIYRGNQFQNGESIPNATAADRINNIEGILILSPIAGEYVVRARAHSILEDSRNDTDPIDQDFALVASGDFAPAGDGVISLDRNAYRSPDSIRIYLADKDLAGQATATVMISSGAEPLGEQIILNANGPRGAFTGAVITATGPAAADGKLQVAHGNTAVAAYPDASSGTTRVASAGIDLMPPTLSQVGFQVWFASPRVTWNSSEPASSVVIFGTNSAALDQAVTNLDLTTSHSLTLGRILLNVPYYYKVLGADEAGNWTTNDIGGAPHTFTVTRLAPLLVVDAWPDDPELLGAPPISGYTNALNPLGIDYDLWDTATLGSPADAMPGYRGVIWRFPELGEAWTAAERTAVSNYLHSGGSMMIASMEVLSRLTDADFIKNVLHVQSFLTDEQGSDGVSAIDGENLDPVASGFSASLDYAVYDELWAEYGGLLPSDISDTVFPDNEASALFFDEDTDSVGLRWPGLGKEAPGRLALLTFPLDAVPMDGTPNGRTALLERILSFLMPGASQNATLRFGAAAYQSPGIATIELGDSDLAGLGSLSLTVTNTSNATGVTITMIESAAPGQFGGSVPLTTAPQPPVGSLRALHGEVLQASYLDASASTTRTAATAVDNLPPVISNISGEPDYVDAIIYWDTSEPADSLVLFGDSPLMGRSAYTASLETGHAVVLPSLVPDRVYYYRVFSRDTGGNLAQGQTGTNVYQFRTKTPVSLPWTDGMDDGGTNWSTYTEETVAAPPGASGWTLGPLENGMTTNAHSPPHCWGTNLKGEPLEGMESFLISPAFYLPADRSAALTFWHSYDFYDYSGFDIEFGGIQVSVNNGPLLDVTSYFDSSYGEWEQATVDLTPYAGNMVLIVWHYALLGFEPGPRPGWTVDDVSITSQEYSGGAIRITNNIWQADYVLSGKLSRAGKGPLTISNAPPGQYFLEFAPVPYYFTPSAQTNTLAPGQTLVLVGTYTFADANNNGISDAWETNFFKTIDPARTPSTDSDGDGMSDYAEFVTGTDPTGPDRPFALKSWRTNAGEFTIEWPSIPGETYSVQSAASLANWTLAVPEIQASSTVSRVTVPMTGNRSFFRVAKSQAATNTLPESLRLSLARVPGGIRLSWRSPNGCGYQIESTADLQNWTPASSWIRAKARTTTLTIPGPAASRTYYRLRAEP